MTNTHTYGMRPRIEWLETFLAIIETGSLTRTGERIGRTQSAVSLQLRHLEDAVGARLFLRDRRRMVLTEAGEKLVPLARRAVDAADAAAMVVRDHERRVIRVGVPDEYVDLLMPGLLTHLARRDPGLAVEVQCASSAVLERRIRGDRLDMAFALAEETDGGGEPVATDPVVWLQAPQTSLSHRRPLPVALFDHACSWRSRAIEALEAAGVDYRVVFTSASVAGVRAGIRAGFAVGPMAVSTAGTGLVRIRGGDAPPALAPAELILLRGSCRNEDIDLLVGEVRDLVSTGRTA